MWMNEFIQMQFKKKTSINHYYPKSNITEDLSAETLKQIQSEKSSCWQTGLDMNWADMLLAHTCKMKENDSF